MFPHLSTRLRSWGGLSGVAAVLIASFLSVARCGASEMDDVRKQLLAGKYADVADVAAAAEKTEPEVEDWPLMRSEALM